MDLIVDTSTHIKAFCMLTLKLIQSPDMDFNALKDLLSGKNTEYRISPVLLDKFNEQIEELLREGISALLNMMGNAGRLIGSGAAQVTKWSVLGLFLRRVLLHFDKLPFSQVSSM